MIVPDETQMEEMGEGESLEGGSRLEATAIKDRGLPEAEVIKDRGLPSFE